MIPSFYGFDLGVRSAYMCEIKLGKNGISFRMEKIELKAPKKNLERRDLELFAIKEFSTHNIEKNSIVYVEEPLVAGARNLRTSLKIAQVSGVVMASAPDFAKFVPVSSWKKEIVGKGNAKKEEISEFLLKEYKEMWAECNEDQNLIDAACVALYGVKEWLKSNTGLAPKNF
jgi:Holliday junction resolvasome RuvABC endonuclease subunit